MRWLWQHGRLCESTEGDGPGCSTDLVMSPNVIQHTQRKEGKRLREASCRPDVRLHVRLQARCSRCRSLTQAELEFELELGLGRGQLQVIKGRGFYNEILKIVRYDFTWNQTSPQICKKCESLSYEIFLLVGKRQHIRQPPPITAVLKRLIVFWWLDLFMFGNLGVLARARITIYHVQERRLPARSLGGFLAGEERSFFFLLYLKDREVGR